MIRFRQCATNSVTVCEGFAARPGAVRAGCSGYFTKPLDIEMLVDCLDRLTGVQPAEPYRILIVDDSRLVAAAHALNLQQAGFETEIVTDPTQTMQSLVSFAPDLILMDLNMPECNGIELASVIRQQSLYLSTPIVFLSSETDRSRQLTAIEQGGDDFLTKPLRPDHLVTASSSAWRGCCGSGYARRTSSDDTAARSSLPC